MVLYFVRHTPYTNPNNLFAFHLPMYLSEEGRKHAHRIGEWFTKNGGNKLPIVTSPIVRCVQTSEILATHTNSFVTTDERLIETRLPNLQGTKQPHNQAWVIEEKDESREPREAILKRVLSVYNERIDRGQDCILVSHGDPITILYYHLNKMEFPEYLWSPENKKNVIQRGDIVKIEITPYKLDTTRIKV